MMIYYAAPKALGHAPTSLLEREKENPEVYHILDRTQKTVDDVVALSPRILRYGLRLVSEEVSQNATRCHLALDLLPERRAGTSQQYYNPQWKVVYKQECHWTPPHPQLYGDDRKTNKNCVNFVTK